MKKIIFICACVSMLAMTACSDWIDVSPKTDVESSELFNSESGFKNALIGIYGRMTFVETYGREMTFGYVEELVQRYDIGGNAYDPVRADDIYDYVTTGTDSKNRQATIWAQMYQTIANINSLLSYIETQGDNIITEGYHDLIKGEALGLRAFHYFDLLRMWGPVYSEDPTAESIPFRDKFTADLIAPMPANEVAQRILDDLHEADSLLVNDGMNYDYNADEIFTCERQYRMNKYAVKALLARVYLWIGDKEQAAYYAKEVIAGCGLELVRDNGADVSMKGETLFGLQMDDMENTLSSYWTDDRLNGTQFAGSNLCLMLEDNWQTVFETRSVGQNDIRATSFAHDNSNPLRYMCQKYLGDEQNEVEGFYENIPLIRLSEMYYILAECVSLSESVDYLNDVRNARGISRANNYTFNASYTEDVRKEALRNEYSKDFFAEGQYFYFLKRNNYDTFYRCPIANMRNYYVFPLPDDEVEFGGGQVDDNEGNEN